ncbi:PI-PLC domain-containing protein [Burkholderia cepacia]|uniref:hypothetical protein n=1 Tax=Burkholderia cepacia TaxID=292 RepID=UPI00075CF84C|nr:hypothetical protein [Burkholderia cepacia]OUE44199.1 phosphodiesterase [Burkholderia territorii]EMD9437593.1 hypothetical protein [Burkholderia cepacia]KWC77579.1 phosphodiesterase [Burkholderia cepacia]KWH54008.1 phosphodiesterase [Burkholderia cepacia]RQZ87475.1 phosphodiesterase [Burkholderia cepacia]
MKIISHRGFWLEREEKNTLAAFNRSFDQSFGTETDVRDLNGALVISHDPPKGGEMLLSEFLELLTGRDLTLAINIKADGLAKGVVDAFKTSGLKNWFVFDMSVPDMRGYLAEGVPVYARLSEVEQTPPFADAVQGIWLDGFDGVWYTPEVIEHYLAAGKDICIVSSELHGRDPAKQWEMLKTLKNSERVTLCTDFPDRARKYFGDVS